MPRSVLCWLERVLLTLPAAFKQTEKLLAAANDIGLRSDSVTPSRVPTKQSALVRRGYRIALRDKSGRCPPPRRQADTAVVQGTFVARILVFPQLLNGKSGTRFVRNTHLHGDYTHSLMSNLSYSPYFPPCIIPVCFQDGSFQYDLCNDYKSVQILYDTPFFNLTNFQAL